MNIDSLITRSNQIRSKYHELEEKHHGSTWTLEEDLLALSNDIGNLNRLAMTKLNRYYDETPYTLEQKIAENIWWLTEIATRLDIDLEKELENFLTDKEASLNIR